jgi:ATP-dependent DNA helicase RecQ
VLRAKETIWGVWPEADAPAGAGKRKGEAEYDGALFDLLRRRRKELADAAHVPPYMIFSDRSLTDMAAHYPRTREAMLAVNGVGEVKFKHFGPAFMELIEQYCQQKGIPAKGPAPRRAAPPVATEKTGVTPRHVVVAEAFNAGKSLSELVEQYQVKVITILDHLTLYTQEGGELRATDEFAQILALPPELQAATLAAFAELGPEKLRPVYDRMNALVNYDELKILRLIFLSQGG